MSDATRFHVKPNYALQNVELFQTSENRRVATFPSYVTISETVFPFLTAAQNSTHPPVTLIPFVPGNPPIPANTECDPVFTRFAADAYRYPMMQMCVILIFFQLAHFDIPQLSIACKYRAPPGSPNVARSGAHLNSSSSAPAQPPPPGTGTPSTTATRTTALGASTSGSSTFTAQGRRHTTRSARSTT
ncbi:hypothetical protein B0H17DRAFT_1188591 [Mycena rosella]|uniref:Uncharacterized protein n=1 Tax=Mycena rosella TaxID=1033263 RepID=A0AAD7BF34_MYCRO|nr:hypothetical protein B0H17DRAFT_1188591 [Mycena rosella]